MWPYWVMFIVPALAAMQESVSPVRVRNNSNFATMPTEWRWIMLALALLVGWRHQVGGDWINYLGQFQNAYYESKYSTWWLNDPGYRLLEYVALQMDWGMHGVNLMSASIFSFGLVVFCRHLPRPWLALAVAVPYLVIILGMGYSRQGVALGCMMVGLVALGNGQVLKFVIWAVLGATFHKSAVLLLPMAALAATENRGFTLLWVGVVVFMSYGVLLEDSVAHLQAGYVDASMQSEGALIRLLMNAFPAVLLLANRDRFKVNLPRQRLWFWFAVASLALFGVYFYSPSSTAVDRVGLYLLPIQLMVFSYLPEMLGRNQEERENWVFYILLYYGAVAFVWLNYATHAFAWLPYRFYLLE
ncbi:MAG: EpsG family protein [Fluviibacter sp.]